MLQRQLIVKLALVRSTTKNAFYDQLDNLVSGIPKHDVQIISGDMNAQAGYDRTI